MDLRQQIDYWLEGSKEDLDVAETLFNNRKFRHALFFTHLAVEKILKAHVIKNTKDVPPHIHDLLRLADLAGLTIPESQRTFLARLQRYCIEGRYSDQQSPTLLEDASKNIIQEARNIFSWLANQLK